MAENRPIIIVRKKGGHGGHHAGAWKVAYADFVTALMALFIVLWLMNTSKEVQEAVGGYFKDPAGFANKIGSGKIGSGDNFTLSKDNMSQLREELQKAIQAAPNFDKIKDQIEMTITPDGLRVELMETEVGTFFQSGVAEPTQGGKETLIKLAEELGKLPNKISLEGHTDSRPFARGGSYGNWELSTDRANAARRLMQEHGLGPAQVTQVRGYADQRLRKTDNPEDPSNRRISLIVQYQPKQAPEESKPADKGHAAQGQAPATPAKAAAEKPHAPAPASGSGH